MAKRRPHWFSCIVLVAASAAMLGCGNHDSERSDPSRIERIDRALSAAAAYLIGQQAPEGDWRPDTYGAFKDGGSLTPLVLQALYSVRTSFNREPPGSAAAALPV